MICPALVSYNNIVTKQTNYEQVAVAAFEGQGLHRTTHKQTDIQIEKVNKEAPLISILMESRGSNGQQQDSLLLSKMVNL